MATKTEVVTVRAWGGKTHTATKTHKQFAWYTLACSGRTLTSGLVVDEPITCAKCAAKAVRS